MCRKCNGLLDATIEKPAKDLVRSLIPWDEQHAWPTLIDDECRALAKWVLKVGMLSAHPDVDHDNPVLNSDKGPPKMIPFHSEWIDWLRNGDDPPEGFTVFLSLREVADEPPYQGAEYLIFLPRLAVDGVDMYYATTSFGLRGLEFTIVWHPGWPIDNPLIDSGRAVVLWPSPSTVDLDALPLVHPREVRFVDRALGTMFLTGDEFREAVLTPLGPTNDAFSTYFGNSGSGLDASSQRA